jgi:hypothetical protein
MLRGVASSRRTLQSLPIGATVAIFVRGNRYVKIKNLYQKKRLQPLCWC